MDTYEATKIVLSRIQNLDPENASKIMGYILIQDHSEKDMIRLAFGPETVLISLIHQVKLRLRLLSNTSSTPPPFIQHSPRSILIPPNNGGSHNVDSCMYYAKGYCKNGNSCRFMHGGFGEESDYFDEIMRVKVLQQQQQQQQQRFIANHHPFGYNKCMNILPDNNQRSAAAALMTTNEFHKYGRSLPDRNDFSSMGLGGNWNSSSRQIYLTFPADSTFKEEDVSNYFSMYGPVQDVRIPYQQKRMFGFVTFVFPETVKLILAKGNPHFVCDSRVLVKPYKEKGKILDEKQQQQFIDRGELSACLSPSAVESGELYDTPFGARMFYNSHEDMILRRKLEQDAELQQAIDFQGRRLMNLQWMDMKNQHHGNHFPPSHYPGVPSVSQTQPQFPNSQGLVCSSNGINQEVITESNGVQEPTKPPVNAADEKVSQETPHTNENGSLSKEQASKNDDSDPQERTLEHVVPDNLLASPTKSDAEHVVFSTASAEACISSPVTAATTATNTSTSNIPVLPTTSSLNMASVESCYIQIPRFVSGQEATET